MSEGQAPAILIVDDDEIVLKSIRSYLALETEYKVLAFLNPGEALDAVHHQEIDLVISDYLMPEMNGLDFLGKVKEIQPLATRIMLTAYADKENAIKAINEVGLFQYIEKPWDNDQLRIVIRNGLERKNLMQELSDTLKQFQKSQDNLQSIHDRILKTFV